MAYTVKQLSDLAGVSVRTLHYYDEIELLKPSSVGENGYRYYEDEAVFRLQQILFFREMDLSLKEIKEIVEMPEFDLLEALQAHRDRVEAKIRRLSGLVQTIDNTILYFTGEVDMSKKKLFEGFTKEEEEHYVQEAREQWGAEQVDVTYKRWNSYPPQKQAEIKAEGKAIYRKLAALIEQSPDSPDVQALIARWHQHLRHFYEPSVERLLGLGQLYTDNPDFARTFSDIHPKLAPFMREAIAHYCAQLDQ